MGSRFIALPVGQGDAFYLKRENLHLLVDGGRAKRALPGLLKAHAAPSRLDVVICTHNDADHANGLIGLLEDQPVPIHEVWLPGTWAWRFEDLVAHPYEFVQELAHDIYDVGEEVETLEQYYEQYWERLRSSIETSEIARIPDQDADTGEWLMDIFDRQDIFPWRSWREHWYLFKPPYPIFRMLHYPICRRLWLECLNAAHRIKSIAEAALNAGARIRLFEFVQSPDMAAGGYQGQLEPINSREVWPRRVNTHRVNISALLYLALTTANRESLVFYAPEQANNNCPSVLFTADSDLACKLTHVQKPIKNIIVTAPHHGSEANRSAYTEVTNWIEADKVIWVRSDSRSKKRPGDTFKGQLKRLCTLCNPPTGPKSTIRLHAVKSHWQRTRGTGWCLCK